MTPQAHRPPSPVIFDLDGTLIDTEKYYRIFWPRALACFGCRLTDEQALSLRSLGRPFAPALLKKWFGEDLDYDAVRRCRKEMMESYLEQVGVDCKPGARELLEALRDRGIPTALATATDRKRAEHYLGKLGLLPYFTHVLCATEVKEGKPAPDIYLYACEKLGRRPEECFAVEDSPNGVMSAYRAGCRVIMVPDLTQPDGELEKLLYARADSLADVLPLLKM